MGPIEINGRAYALPAQRTVVVCLDGCDPAYLDDALERRLMPRLAEMLDGGGSYTTGRCQLPSFTNPNNVTIVTGVPASVHGIPGNHVLGPDGAELQLTEATQLRAQTIPAALAAAGVPVACVTTKDKLRRLLGADGVLSLSAERAHEQAVPVAGRPLATSLVGRANPGIYDPDCSLYALELGRALGRALDSPCLLYVSLTDYVQHTAAPGDTVTDRFLAGLDRELGRYLDEGYVLGLAADHGMNAKPSIVFLGDRLDDAGVVDHHVVLPITDPYVVHHAALGSAAWVHVDEDVVATARAALAQLPGIEEVLTRSEAADSLELPADRIGDLVVLADATTALGRRQAEHDLSALRSPLRSHGGRHEQAVPIVVSHPLDAAGAGLVAAGARNADIHALVLNHLRQAS